MDGDPAALDENRIAYAETHCTERPYPGGIMRCVRVDNWKYINRKSHDLEELFQLTLDPEENQHLIASEGERADHLRVVMQELILHFQAFTGEAGKEI